MAKLVRTTKSKGQTKNQKQEVVGEAARAVVKAMLISASEDEQYRQLCLNDPASAFKKLTGQDLCEGASLRFAEHGTIPLRSLSNKDLEMARNKLWLQIPKDEKISLVAWYGIIGTFFADKPE